MCGGPADSSEHIFKARDLRRIFDQDGYAFDDLPFHFHAQGLHQDNRPEVEADDVSKADLRGLSTASRSSDFDRAYDQLSDWLTTQQASHAMTAMDFRVVFGADCVGAINALRRYCAKALGCKILRRLDTSYLRISKPHQQR